MNQMLSQHQIVGKKEIKTTTAKKDRREGKGRVLAISRNVFRLQQNTNTFYVESESSNDHHYFVKFKPEVFESWYCSCKDNSTRHIKCKHIFAIEFAIKWGTIRDIDQLPPTADVKEDTQIVQVIKSLSYKDDVYTF